YNLDSIYIINIKMFFKDIVGHEFQKKALIRTARERRISHAYLFSGPDGVGKRIIAAEFAKILNCLRFDSISEEDTSGERCDCNSCKKIDKGIHPDVFFVEYKGLKNIKVDQIREEVEERIFFRPFEGRFKVAVVDEAERMNPNAQNAFLKTLEEPPEDSVIILVSSQPEFLLPTIKSRCQLLQFNGISQEIMLEKVRKSTDLSPEEAWVVVKLSCGSLGKALGFKKDVLSERRETIIKLSEINPKYASHVLGFVDSMPTSSSSDDLERLAFVFEIIASWLRDLLLIEIGYEEDDISNRDLVPVIRKLKHKWSADKILDKIKSVENAWYSIFRGNANKQMALENMVLKIAE
ncbi:MAG: DNA polymerase III subunit delta', partial [Thermodesulfobacteriota bacterium]